MLDNVKSLMTKFNTQLNFAKNENLNNLVTSINSIGIYRRASNLMLNYEKKIYFKSQDNEIMFYKSIKPKFIAQFFYFQKIISVEKKKSNLKAEERYNYLFSKRIELLEFDTMNTDFILYIKSNQSADDKYYFSTSNCSKYLYDENLYLEVMDTAEPKFDILMAQYLANEMLHIYFIEEIKKATIDNYLNTNKMAHWTGSQVELVELIYGLHVAGLLGDGQEKISVLIENFSLLFGVKVSNYIKVFEEIRERTKSRTRLFDKLTKHLTNYMNSLEK